MADGDALALHVVAAHGGGVQQHVNEVVVEQVHLVHVEDAPVGGGNQPGLEAAAAGADGLLDVQRTHEAVLGCAHGQVNDAHLAGYGRGFFSVRAEWLGIVRVATVRAATDDRDFRQQARQGAHGGGLGGALLAANQHAADAGVHSVQDERPLHRGLADDGGEGKARLASVSPEPVEGLRKFSSHAPSQYTSAAGITGPARQREMFRGLGKSGNVDATAGPV